LALGGLNSNIFYEVAVSLLSDSDYRATVAPSRSPTGRASRGYLGLQSGGATRMSKIVCGTHPGITYRLYFSAAVRPGFDNGGLRVYVREPTIGDLAGGEVEMELIAHGEFLGPLGVPSAGAYNTATARTIDYTTDKEINFGELKGSTHESELGVPNDADFPPYPGLSHEGFQMFHVDFTPVRGNYCVEIIFENAYVPLDIDTDSAWAEPTGWSGVDPDDFFGNSSQKVAARAAFGDTGGPWEQMVADDNTSGSYASAADGRVSSDSTFFIDNVFIGMVYSAWAERLQLQYYANQGGYTLDASQGDNVHMPGASQWKIKNPFSMPQVLNGMADWTGTDGSAVKAGDDPSAFGESGSFEGWRAGNTSGYFPDFGLDTDSVAAARRIDVIKRHPLIRNYDPFSVTHDDGECLGLNTFADDQGVGSHSIRANESLQWEDMTWACMAVSNSDASRLSNGWIMQSTRGYAISLADARDYMPTENSAYNEFYKRTDNLHWSTLMGGVGDFNLGSWALGHFIGITTSSKTWESTTSSFPLPSKNYIASPAGMIPYSEKTSAFGGLLHEGETDKFELPWFGEFTCSESQFHIDSGNFEVGKDYVITSLGNTDWSDEHGPFGSQPDVGLEFTAVVAGTGSGKAAYINAVNGWIDHAVFGELYIEPELLVDSFCPGPFIARGPTAPAESPLIEGVKSKWGDFVSEVTNPDGSVEDAE